MDSVRVRKLTDRSEIMALLETDRIYAAYALGDLEPGLFEQCQWFAAENGDGAWALVVSFAGLSSPILFVMGSSDGVRRILGEALSPQEAYVTMRAEHVPAVGGLYRLDAPHHMYRMMVDQNTFRPVERHVTLLRGADIHVLNRLYAWGGESFFSSYQLERGVYYGISRDGRLVAAAGTHIVSPRYGIGAVGNVFTHPDYRNQGLATACTSAVTAELLRRGCRQVVLNVRQDNGPAVHAYHKLGYRIYCSIIELHSQRRSGVERLMHRLVGRTAM